MIFVGVRKVYVYVWGCCAGFCVVSGGPTVPTCDESVVK